MRILTRAIALLAATALLTLALAEAAVRWLSPMPRVQIIRARPGFDLSLAGGVPVWEEPWKPEQKGEACADGADVRVGILGDSILYGSSVPREQTFSHLLQRKLDAAGEGRRYCVMNWSQPGMSFEPKLKLAERYLPRHRPQLLFWGIWSPEPTHYTVVGDAAFNFSRMATGRDGLPSVFALPAGLNAWLFRRSRLYEYATLATATPRYPTWESEWRPYVERKLPRLVELARRHGTRLAFVLCPPLDRELSRFAGKPFPEYRFLAEELRRRGLASFSLAEELAGHDHRAIRLDPCCHYNARGHALLADVFLARTRELVGEAVRTGDR